MSGPGVGFEYPPTEVSWLKRDALLFANSIGCTSDELQFLYVSYSQWLCDQETLLTALQELNPKFAVFPTYPLVLRSFCLPPP